VFSPKLLEKYLNHFFTPFNLLNVNPIFVGTPVYRALKIS